MKIVSATINSLLAAMLTLSALLVISGHVTKAEYIDSAAEKSDIYKSIAKIVSEDLSATTARNTGLPETVIRKNVSAVVTQSYIQQKSGEVTEQIEQALRGERTKIVIEFSDLIKLANAKGLSLNSTDIKPVEIAVPSHNSKILKIFVQNLTFITYLAIVMTLILLIAAVLLSMRMNRFLGLAGAFFTSGVVLLVISGLSVLIGAEAQSLVNLTDNIQVLNPSIEQFTKTVSSDVARFSGLVAVLYTFVSAAIFFTLCRTKSKW